MRLNIGLLVAQNTGMLNKLLFQITGTHDEYDPSLNKKDLFIIKLSNKVRSMSRHIESTQVNKRARK